MFQLLDIRAVPARDVCSKVTPVKSIHLLNVVVKQVSLIKTYENKTGDVLSCYVQQQQSSILLEAEILDFRSAAPYLYWSA